MLSYFQLHIEHQTTSIIVSDFKSINAHFFIYLANVPIARLTRGLVGQRLSFTHTRLAVVLSVRPPGLPDWAIFPRPMWLLIVRWKSGPIWQPRRPPFQRLPPLCLSTQLCINIRSSLYLCLLVVTFCRRLQR